jgi:hypothetical protein
VEVSLYRTTGKSVCADGQKLRQRPNIGAVGVAPPHGSPANGPSGQKSRRRSPSWPDGMPSVPVEPSGQTLAVSQPFGPPNGVILQGPDPTACRRLSLFFSFKNRLLICILF